MTRRSRPRIRRPKALSLVLTVFIFLLIVIVRLTPRDQSRHYRPPAENEIVVAHIPNIIHYVWTVPKDEEDFVFQFKHFLSIYAAVYHFAPDAVYIHTNAKPGAISRAIQGQAGKWSQLILNGSLPFLLPPSTTSASNAMSPYPSDRGGRPTLRIMPAEAPVRAGNGVEITHEEHKGDFIRAGVLLELGGIYLDWDVFALRDIKPLRKSGFDAVVGRLDSHHQVNSGTILCKPGARLVDMYKSAMHEVYDGRYTTHSNYLLTGLADRLVRRGGSTPDGGGADVLILDQNAFTPGGWMPQHLNMLWKVHSDVVSNLEGLDQGDEMPYYDDSMSLSGGYNMVTGKVDESWFLPESLQDGWEKHFYESYVIHGFQPGVRDIHGVEGFDGLSPRYVLERRSNFARAMYEVVKDMYTNGLVGIDDAVSGY